jgi:hypothetical protein
MTTDPAPDVDPEILHRLRTTRVTSQNVHDLLADLLRLQAQEPGRLGGPEPAGASSHTTPNLP